MPANPISMSVGQASRGGSLRTINSNSTLPIANRGVMSVTGDTSRNAAFVATKDMHQKMTAMSAPRRGRNMGNSVVVGGRGVFIDESQKRNAEFRITEFRMKNEGVTAQRAGIQFSFWIL